MNVLVVAPQVPWPPHQGTSLRNFNILRVLAQRHTITVLAFGDPGAPLGPLPDLGIAVIAVPLPPRRPLTVRALDLFATPVPDLARRLASPAMEAAIAALAGAVGGKAVFDVVQIEGLEMALHGLAAHAALTRRQMRRPRLVYDGHNAEWVLQHRAWQTDLRRPRTWPGALYSVVQTWKLRRFERRLLGASDAVVAVSAADAAALRAVAGRARPPLAIVPNGVDTGHYAVADPDAVAPELCVFTGKMDFRPNIDAVAWLCAEVWPRVRSARPGARLAIVGRDPAPRVTGLADPSAGVEVVGAVPDVRPWIGRAGVVVVPLRVGGGTRLKVLEAMAMGKAIAATSLAVEGLDLIDGREADVRDAPADLAAAIGRLIGDPDRRRDLGRRARERAVADFRWERLVPAIEALYGGSP